MRCIAQSALITASRSNFAIYQFWYFIVSRSETGARCNKSQTRNSDVTPFTYVSSLIGQYSYSQPTYWLKTFPIKMQTSCQLVHVAEYIQCHYSPRRSSVITCYYHVVSLISFCQGWGANHSLIVTPLSLCVVMGACLLYSDVVFPFSRTMSPPCQSLVGDYREERLHYEYWSAAINRWHLQISREEGISHQVILLVLDSAKHRINVSIQKLNLCFIKDKRREEGLLWVLSFQYFGRLLLYFFII